MRFAGYLTGFVYLGLLLINLYCNTVAQENVNILSLTERIPASVSQQLDSLQKTDNLEEWLYTIGGYVEGDAVSRVPLLQHIMDKVWRSSKTDPERLAWFTQLTVLGYYQLFRGDILSSINAYEKAYQFYFEKPIPHADVLEYVLKPLGNNYTRLGDYDQAFFIQEKSLLLATEQKNAMQIASIYCNLATSARWKGKLNQAQQYGEKGLQEVRKNTALHGLLLSTLSDILFESKQFAASETRINESIKILENSLHKRETNAAYWLLSAYQTQGNLLKEKNKPAAALHSYQKAKTISDRYFKGERKREMAKLAVLMGDVLLQMKHSRQAMEKFNSSLAVLIPAYKPKDLNTLPDANLLYGENTFLDALEGKARCLLALNKKEEALQCFQLLFVAERKLRHEFFSSAAKQQHQRENRQWIELGIQTGYELWQSTGNKKYAEKVLLMTEMSKAQLLLDELVTNLHYNRIKSKDTLLQRYSQAMKAIAWYEREAAINTGQNIQSSAIKKELQYDLSLIQKKVNEKYALHGEEITINEVDGIRNLLSQVSPGTTVLEFFAGEQDIYIIEATKNGVQGIRKLENASKINQTIREFVIGFFQRGPDKMINDPHQYYKDAYAIYSLLWNDAGKEKTGRYIIIPDGIIGYLPFDGLVTDSIYQQGIDRWPLLIRQAETSFLYSLQTLKQQQRFGLPSPQNAVHDQFTGFFISFDSSKNEALPAVKKETALIRNIVKGNYYEEQKASLEKFKTSLDKTNILHISTHSYLQGEENLPVLQLADDKFFLFELYGQLFQPQIVVLSACRTGHGMLVKGEGVISLARGFTASGAGGILASLWNMHDESTASLMGNFYNRLIKVKLPAKALHDAKLDWLGQDHEQTFKKLPYFWAGLVYAGNGHPIVLNPKKTGKSNLWLAAAALVIVALIVRFLSRRKTTH